MTIHLVHSDRKYTHTIHTYMHSRFYTIIMKCLLSEASERLAGLESGGSIARGVHPNSHSLPPASLNRSLCARVREGACECGVYVYSGECKPDRCLGL